MMVTRHLCALTPAAAALEARGWSALRDALGSLHPLVLTDLACSQHVHGVVPDALVAQPKPVGKPHREANDDHHAKHCANGGVAAWWSN